MQAKKKRLALDLDPAAPRHLKGVATFEGVSMRRYCLAATDRELDQDAADGAFAGSFNIESLVALQDEAFGGTVLPGDGAEFIREARESRNVS